ncbi:MAG: PocR ligand-binding domain-containing protein [Desulfobacterales bacterium]
MTLTDILPLEKWIELEKKIYKRSGLNSNVFDVNGIRISDFQKWPNDLCPTIKANDKGQSFICAVAHMNLAAQARHTGEAVIEECDAGLFKVVYPVFAKGEFLGVVAGCGLLLDGSETDTFLINKITDIDEKKIEKLSIGIERRNRTEIEELACYMKEEVDKITGTL